MLMMMEEKEEEKEEDEEEDMLREKSNDPYLKAGEKHKDFLCNFRSVFIYVRIAKPFMLPLQLFRLTKNEEQKMTIYYKSRLKSPHLRSPGGSRRRL